MKVIDLPLESLTEAEWNSNVMDEAMLSRLRQSLLKYGLVQNLVVRPAGNGHYEVLSGNQRLQLLREAGWPTSPCVIVDLDDRQARLLSMALNHINGEDDLGLKALLLKDVLAEIPQAEVLKLLPESTRSLQDLARLDEQSVADYLQSWQQAQPARLKHLTIQVTPGQLEVIEEAFSWVTPERMDQAKGNPNPRGNALFQLCKNYLELLEK